MSDLNISLLIWLCYCQYGQVVNWKLATEGNRSTLILSAGLYALCFNNDGAEARLVQIQIDIWRAEEILQFHKEQEEADNSFYKSSVRIS